VARAGWESQIPREEVPGDRADEPGEHDVERDRVGVDDPSGDSGGDLEEEERAMRGEIAPVEPLVAIEFAVSWKPFVKSKKSAIATTATSVASMAVRRS
jgi:hypothetical protein